MILSGRSMISQMEGRAIFPKKRKIKMKFTMWDGWVALLSLPLHPGPISREPVTDTIFGTRATHTL